MVRIVGREPLSVRPPNRNTTLLHSGTRIEDPRTGAFDHLAGVTARLASMARLDEIVDMVVVEISSLGFGAVWVAVIDESTGKLTTLKEMVDGVDMTHKISVAIDSRKPIGLAIRDRRVVNIADPRVLHLLDSDEDPVPPGKLALPRTVFDLLRGRPFACCPLLGSRGQPVGALGLSWYLAGQPIPEAVFSHGLLRVFMDHVGIAIERALQLAQLEAKLRKAHAALAGDAPLKATGEMAAAVAHDLNNLSGIALLAVSVGLRSPADAFDVLPRIARANRAIGDLVARLQRIARPSGEAQSADLGQIVDDILIMVTPFLREHAIEVDLEVSQVPLVRCDAVLLQQVLLNLLINAHDALRGVADRPRRIRIRVSRADELVHLIVADNGPGIADGVFAHLFQPFITTKSGAHKGLGLAGARTALREFGAHIEGRNAVTGGAEFEVTLIAAAAELVATATPREPMPAVADRARGARILAIDDDPDVVDIIRAYLEPLGYDVATATGPSQAIAAAEAQVFDLVLCDVGLPKQSGIDVCRLLREGGYRGKLVLMTGWDTQALAAEPSSAECDGLLKKPFVGTDLIHVIDTLLA